VYLKYCYKHPLVKSGHGKMVYEQEREHKFYEASKALVRILKANRQIVYILSKYDFSKIRQIPRLEDGKIFER